MPITTWTVKDPTIRVCGPWDGKPETGEEFASFLQPENWNRYQGNAEFWDPELSEWCPLPYGHYLVESVSGALVTVTEDQLNERYQPVEDSGSGRCQVDCHCAAVADGDAERCPRHPEGTQ